MKLEQAVEFGFIILFNNWNFKSVVNNNATLWILQTI